MLQKRGWPETLLPFLEETAGSGFSTAAAAAERLGIDTWPYRLRRQKGLEPDANDAEWRNLLNTSNPDRLDAALALAEEQIDLASVAAGAVTVTVTVTEPDCAPLGFTGLRGILIALLSLPGKGTRFVEAALHSAVVGHRNMALQCREAWGKGCWPTDIENTLKQMLKTETDDFARGKIQKLLQ